MKIVNLTPHPLVIELPCPTGLESSPCHWCIEECINQGIGVPASATVLHRYADPDAVPLYLCDRCAACRPTWTFERLPNAPLVIPSSGIARCEQTDEVIGDVDGIQVVRTKFGAVTGLPDELFICAYSGDKMESIPPSEHYAHGYPNDPWEKYRSPEGMACGHIHAAVCAGRYETVYVVSSITAQAVPHRRDVFVPARLIRDEQGRIIACAALGRVSC